MDADGYLSLAERLADVVNVDGDRVSPREATTVILEAKGVAACVRTAEEDSMGSWVRCCSGS